MFHQGWSDDFCAEDLSRKVEGWPEYLLPKKRKRKIDEVDGMEGGVGKSELPVKTRGVVNRVGYYGHALIDLSGNAMGLPDLSVLLQGLTLAGDSDVWSEPPPEDFVGLVAGGSSLVQLDPDSSAADRRALLYRLGEDPAQADAKADEDAPDDV